MDKKDLVDLSTIYIKLHKLNEEDTNYLIDKVQSYQTDHEIWEFLLSGGSPNIQEVFGDRSFSKDTANMSDWMISKLWKYLYGELTGDDWDTRRDMLVNTAKDVGTGVHISAGIVSVLILTALIIKSIKFIREKLLVKERKECKGLVGARKDLCEAKYALLMKKMEMGVIRRGLTVCPKTKNPSVCKQKLESRFSKVKVDITKKQSEIKDLMIKVRNKKQ